MTNDYTAITLAIIAAISSIITGGFVTWQQLKKDKLTTALDSEKTQDEIEERLWQRAKKELDAMSERIDSQAAIIKMQDATIAEQGAVIMQLRDTVESQAKRIETLENENGRLVAENERLKNNKGGKI